LGYARWFTSSSQAAELTIVSLPCPKDLTKRWSAYEGCQSQGVICFFYLFAVILSRFVQLVSLIRRAPLSVSVRREFLPSPAPIRAVPTYWDAHDVVPDLWRSRLGRNAPHLSDDPAPAGPASAPSSVPPCGRIKLKLVKPFCVKVEGLNFLLVQFWCLAMDSCHFKAQFGRSGPPRSPAPQINGQLSGQGDCHFLFQRRPKFKLL
jgi:hypothetical protein